MSDFLRNLFTRQPEQTVDTFFVQLWEEASNDPEVIALRGDCPYDCGWWTMSVKSPDYPDLLQLDVQTDIGRHVFHDCEDAPLAVKEALGLRPLPSH